MTVCKSCCFFSRIHTNYTAFPKFPLFLRQRTHHPIKKGIKKIQTDF